MYLKTIWDPKRLKKNSPLIKKKSKDKQLQQIIEILVKVFFKSAKVLH